MHAVYLASEPSNYVRAIAVHGGADETFIFVLVDTNPGLEETMTNPPTDFPLVHCRPCKTQFPPHSFTTA